MEPNRICAGHQQSPSRHGTNPSSSGWLTFWFNIPATRRKRSQGNEMHTDVLPAVTCVSARAVTCASHTRTPSDHKPAPLPGPCSRAKQPHFNLPAFLSIQTPAAGKNFRQRHGNTGGEEKGWTREPQSSTSTELPQASLTAGVQR